MTPSPHLDRDLGLVEQAVEEGGHVGQHLALVGRLEGVDITGLGGWGEGLG